MKQMIKVLLAGTVLLSSGCGMIRSRAEKSTETLRSTLGVKETADPYKALENQMKQSGEELTDRCSDALKELLNSPLVTVADAADWYDTSLEEFRTFADDLGEMNTQYYRLILETEDMNSYKKWNGRLENCFDAWDEALEDTYDAMDDLFYDAADAFAEKTGREELYEVYDAEGILLSEVYSETWDYLLEYDTQVWSEFYDGGRNLEHCREEAEKVCREEHDRMEQQRNDSAETPPPAPEDEETAADGMALEENPPAESEPEPSAAETIAKEEPEVPVRTGIRPEFQETMDGCSSFITEYIAFLNTMESSEDPQTMMSEYFRYLGELQKQMNALSSLDPSDLSEEENELYLKTIAETTGALLMVLN